jgi:hypothetical protein
MAALPHVAVHCQGDGSVGPRLGSSPEAAHHPVPQIIAVHMSGNLFQARQSFSSSSVMFGSAAATLGLGWFSSSNTCSWLVQQQQHLIMVGAATATTRHCWFNNSNT